jgi:hypothetical protein
MMHPRVGILFALWLVFGTGVIPNQNTQQGPVEVVKDFVSLEVSGAVLTPGGWEKVSESLLRREPLAQQKEIIVVSHDYAVSRDLPRAAENVNEAEVYLGYDHLGVIEPDLKWRPPNPQLYPASGFRFRLVLGKNYWEPVPGNQTERELTGSLRWRIDLIHATVFWATAVSDLLKGKTLQNAVQNGNNYMASQGYNERWKIVGAQNVTIP